MLDFIIGAAIIGAAIEAAEDSYSYTTTHYTPAPVRTRISTTTYSRPRRIYTDREIAYAIFDKMYFYESMSDYALNEAFARAYKLIPTDMQSQIRACKYKREDNERCGIRTCAVEISVNYGEYITVYFEVH